MDKSRVRVLSQSFSLVVATAPTSHLHNIRKYVRTLRLALGHKSRNLYLGKKGRTSPLSSGYP